MNEHIVIAAPHFPPRYVAGAELRAYRLARWLVETGRTPTVVCIEGATEATPDGRVGYVRDLYDGIPVHRLTADLSLPPYPLSWGYDHSLLYHYFRQFLADTRPDLVHLISGYLMGLAPLRAARELGIPAVVTLTDFWFLCPKIDLLRGDGCLCWGPEPAECTRCWLNRWRVFRWLESGLPSLSRHAAGWLRRGWLVPPSLRARVQSFSERQQALRQALNQVQAILCITQFLADVHIANGISPDLFHVIPYNQGNQTSSARMIRPSQRAGPIHFAYLGQVSPHKGVEVLVRAFLALETDQRAKLTIHGPVKPPEFEKKLARLAKRGREIAFAGRYEYAQLGDILADVDIVIVPSLWHENAPRTVIEAFQHGVPVIGSDVGGISALVQDGVNGLLFARGDPSSLALGISKIVNNPGLLDQFRSNIPELQVGAVENEQVFRIYRQVLGEAK